MKEVQGGYIAVRAGEILNLLVAYKGGLRPSSIRLYLAAHLEATEQHFTPTHEITLRNLTKNAGLAYRTGQDALRELKAAGLLTLSEGMITFNPKLTPEALPYLEDLRTSENRPVPIPQSMMRLLAKHIKGSEVIAALAHLMRCLFINRGQINESGFAKNSLIIKLTGLCERAIQGARNWMMRIGILTPKSVAQGIVNRFGKCFSITTSHPQTPAKSEDKGPQIFSTYVENAPPLASSLIYTNNDLNNQYLEPVPGNKSGICTNAIKKNPSLTDIQPENLRSLSQLEALYQQALERNWFKHSENQALEFVSAAVRAITTPVRDPVRVFVSLVKGRLKSHITQAQERRAQEKMANYRRKHPDAFSPSCKENKLDNNRQQAGSMASKNIIRTMSDVLQSLGLLECFQLPQKLNS